MYNYKVGLNKAYQKQAKLFEQSDGSKIHRGSDDAVAYSKLLRYNVTQAENDQYRKDVDTAMSLMKTEDATMINMVDIAKTFAEKTIQAANTYNTSADFQSIAKELYVSIDQILSLLNTQQGDRYIFSGQKDTTEPYAMSEENYQRGVPKTLDTAQTKFFKGIVSAGDANVYQMIALTGEDNKSYYLDTESGYIYTKEFVDEGYKELMTLDYMTVSDCHVAAADSDAYRHEAVKEVLDAGTFCHLDSDTYESDSFLISSYFDEKGILLTDSDTNPMQLTLINKTTQTTYSETDTDTGNVTSYTITKPALSDKYTIEIVIADSDTNILSDTKTTATSLKDYEIPDTAETITLSTEITTYSETDSDTGNVTTYKISKPNYSDEYTVETSTADSDGTLISSDVSTTTSIAGYNIPDDAEVTTEEPKLSLDFKTITQKIVTYSGDAKSISMVKHNGATDMLSDVVNVTGQDMFNFNIFDGEGSGNKQSGAALLNDMITVYNKILSEDVDWLNSDGVALSNAAHNSMTIAQTTLGARMQLYDSVSTMLTTQSDSITEDITNVSGVDVAELATRLMEMTTLYNMSLSLGGRILPQSLADYL